MKTLMLVVALLATVTVRANESMTPYVNRVMLADSVQYDYVHEDKGYADDVDDPDAVTDDDAAIDGDTDTGYYNE